ncbi:unnamed protein product [Cylicostephanus goldi]|uniref:GATA-type domain-containing protein n=1 Tax=Cylicostephanus goldi TaxID=71465 RepID=A0A3P7NBX1_CYLGO|nr:unnamed protein product [Cylicostephanus goldi]
MGSFMQTLQESPDFFDQSAFYVPPSSMTLQGSYENGYGMAQAQQPFGNVYYEPSPTIQTPHSSPEPPPNGVDGRFEDFSLATQLPVLNSFDGTYATAEPSSVAANSTKFQNFEPYSVQYFFTTPPDTPPTIFPMGSQSAPARACSSRPNSSRSPDPTPTIRKLLQQKKKRMPAVPCHVNSVCTTCKTRTTSLWRRNHLGEIECK